MQPSEGQRALLGDVEAVLMQPGAWDTYPQSIARQAVGAAAGVMVVAQQNNGSDVDRSFAN